MSKNISKKITPTQLKSLSPARNKKNPQSSLQELDKKIESLVDEVAKINNVHGNTEFAEKKIVTVEENPEENDEIIDADDKKTQKTNNEGIIGRAELEEKLQKKLEEAMKVLNEVKNEEKPELCESEEKDQENITNTNEESAKKSPKKSPVRSKTYKNTNEKWMSPRKQAQILKQQSSDLSNSPKRLRYSQNTEENSSDIEKNWPKGPKYSNRSGISSEIDALFTEKSQMSPDLFSNKQRMSISPIKKIKNPTPSLKKHRSIEDLTALLESFEKSRDCSNKKETIYEQFKKIANKPRPDIHQNEDQARKRSPTRKIEEIDKHLWSDAQRRASIHHEPEDENTDFTIGVNSQRVLARKFLKEYRELLENNEKIPENFEFGEVLQILRDMFFVKQNSEGITLDNEEHISVKFFKQIKKPENLSKDYLVSALLSIQSLYPSQLFQDFTKEDTDFYSFPLIIQSFSIDEELKLSKNFSQMKDQRKSITQKSKTLQAEEYSFKPQLNSESENLAKKKRDEIGGLCSQKRLDFFMQEKQKIQEKADKFRINKEEEELKKCTFKPKIITKTKAKTVTNEHKCVTLYEKSKMPKEVSIKSSYEIELEKNLAECTFAPKISGKKKFKEEPSGLYSKSVQQQIARMQKAREEDARKKAILDGMSPSKAASFVDSEVDNRPRSPGKLQMLKQDGKVGGTIPQINLRDRVGEKAQENYGNGGNLA
ncbi:hypothetical protein SteCoe_26251 [Stentor coeruleus]|uniref:Uncharacterized protein n=1 Tax=Stentor coeruleus TaxID=5963 RepID=A0A1R2BD86_9CILI|nr:hypothetical protein SteCoe_26251 [Stentor coeruleus]